jgi:hypothetical protein
LLVIHLLTWFRVIPGGTHTDGLTSNALVILQDGVYLELLIFNTDNPPTSHPWGSRPPGWIDAADLGTAEDLFQVINGRYGGPLYKPAEAGGRLTKTPEGDERELKWRITRMDGKVPCGELPFFCEDLTPREWRVCLALFFTTNWANLDKQVPRSPPSNSIHPNGVLGVAALTYITPSPNFQDLNRQLTAVFGSMPIMKAVDSGEVATWTVHAPSPVQVETKEGKKVLSAEFRLRAADTSQVDEMKRGTGLWEVAFWVSKGSGGDGTAKSKWGKIRYISTS